MTTSVESRIETIRTYFRKVDAKDATLLDLFTDDVRFFFPKFGEASGKAALAVFAERIGIEAAELAHDIDGLVFTVDGDRIAVEGREWGRTAEGRAWPDGEISRGRFANVFEFEGPLISRTFIYVDPDFTSGDRTRVALYRPEASFASPRNVADSLLVRTGIFITDPTSPTALPDVLALFDEDVDWDIPGDRTRVPWVGARRGRHEVSGFYNDLIRYVEPRGLSPHTILADEESAVIVGELASRVKSTAKLIETPFAIVVKVRDGLIIRYRMLEDSQAVADAATSNLHVG